ncbi:sporulation histidine kinase inhibitor Sda [Paenibacillus agricola]|nr:sporulation histidine kinase inhibitor Sda [Paenibacillus agricola]
MLSDLVLIECFWDSLELELDEDFIELLISEMKERNIEIPSLDNHLFPYCENPTLFPASISYRS